MERREPGGRVGGRGGEERKEKGGEGTYDAVPHREREQEREREREKERKRLDPAYSCPATYLTPHESLACVECI